MAQYQTKYHKLICESFRFLSFAAVVITLLAFLGDLWWDFIPDEIVGKMFVTTMSILIASLVVGIIFTEKDAKEK